MVEREEWHRVPSYVEKVVPPYLEFDFRRLFRRLLRHTALVAKFEPSEFYPE